MIKKISFLLALFGIILSISNVNASTFNDTINEHGMWISNEFINKEKNGIKKYQQMTLIVRNSDGRFVYCIEPGKSIDKDETFIGYDDNQKERVNLTDEQWKKIKLLAYYGYGYYDNNYDHTDIKWYVITQFMIWNVNNLGYDIYFTDKLNGNRIEKYTDEINELQLLIDSHNIVPEFNNEYLDSFLGGFNVYHDFNEVLNKYELETNINASIVGNDLIINSHDIDNLEGTITLKKYSNNYSNEPIVYVSDNSQNLLLPGKLSPVIFQKKYYINYGKVNINKVDFETNTKNPQGQATLKNALYGLYDNNDNLLEEKRTDENANISFDIKLPLGDYYLKEIEASDGYQLDPNKYSVHIDENSYNHYFMLGERVIKENFEITKLFEDNNVIKSEKGVLFGIYNNNDSEEFIGNYTTDNYGKIYFSLPYGSYKLKQLTTYEGYEKIDDYILESKENNNNNLLTFVNKKIKYKVNLNVFNKNTKENISNVEFELFDNNNKKICNNKKCTYNTDENGNIFFPHLFKEGKYTIKLIHNDDFDYLYDKDIINFEVNQNVFYKKVDDYRLIELYYELSRNIKEEEENENIEEKNENIEDNIIEEIPKEKEELLFTSNSIIDNEKIEFDVNDIDVKNDKGLLNDSEIVGEDELEVKVPNTLKNDYNYIYAIIIGVFIIKKLLIKK